MQLFRGRTEVPAGFGPSAVTIGKFDGVHIGHRAVIDRLVATARARDLAATIVTFDRNPLSLLRPEKCPDPLVSLEQKIELLGQAGADATLVLEFDRALADLEPEVFVRELLVDALHARAVLVGNDFRFGARGRGNAALLGELGAAHGFEVVLLDDVRAPGDAERASSTRVRNLLGAGRIRDAAILLGRNPSVRSTVVHGDGRGHTLGFPTANLGNPVEGFVPADGVYAAWARIGGDRYRAAVSVSNNPTFGDAGETRVEAYLLDAQVDAYDRVIELEFVDRVRDIHRFDSSQDLAVALGEDVDAVRGILQDQAGAGARA